ncbi:MAG: CPC_1213 family protein [Clostridium sp.]|uniref:CPC_1213 family protein n=1 Tax=Clostridium sp. TaxID=1506 RepID=UPI002FCB70A1
MNSKMKSTKNNKKQDGKFKKKHVNHNPQVESAKAVYGEPRAKEHDPHDFLI